VKARRRATLRTVASVERVAWKRGSVGAWEAALGVPLASQRSVERFVYFYCFLCWFALLDLVCNEVSSYKFWLGGFIHMKLRKTCRNEVAKNV